MSLLIKGMEMPKQGRVTLQIGADGAVYVVDKCEITAEKYEKNFEVLEVPPHGKLIDADALLKLIDSCMFSSDMVTTRALGMATNWLKEAQTVIPADKDGET